GPDLIEILVRVVRGNQGYATHGHRRTADRATIAEARGMQRRRSHFRLHQRGACGTERRKRIGVVDRGTQRVERGRVRYAQPRVEGAVAREHETVAVDGRYLRQ